MSNSGKAYGKHLHFEVFKNGIRVNPYEFLNKNFFEETAKALKYKVGDYIKINGVYVSSTSKSKLTPLLYEGTITKILPNARNPYLLNDGKIGWVNDNVIVDNDNNYLSNFNYYGFSIVDGLKGIGIDSSYDYRKKLAKLNDIYNYQGTGIQNTEMLKLLKQGKLKYK